jgi:DNA-binding NarL/FixJ family response regulator
MSRIMPPLRQTLCPILVGRDDEMSDLEDAMLAARRGEGQIVLLAGDAGIGKSRLVQELGRRAEAAGFRILSGGCSETDLQVPYLPLVEAIRNHLRQTGEVPPDPDLEPLFGRRRGDPVDPEERRVRLFEAVVRHLEAAAGQRGALLVLEDLHWSDAGTRDLLDYLSRVLAGSRLLVVGTYRADEVDRRHPLLPLLRGWVQRGSASLIELAPLTATGVAAMLAATVGSPDPAVAGRLHRRCEGNPFVLEEILKTEGADPGADIPRTVREAILRRVEKLPERHLTVLRAAAALGEPIDDGVLVELLGPGVAEALEECARQQLLTPLAHGGYGWRHALTREAVYRDMAPTRRLQLHSQLADLCDGRPGYEDIAVCRHLAAAERWDEAVPRCRRAAAEATAVGAFGDAAHLLDLCLEHVPEARVRGPLLQELVLLLVQAGRPEEGERHGREAVRLWELAGDIEAAAEARRALSVCLWQQARWDEAIALEEQTIAELDALGPTPLLAESLARRAAWGVIARDEVAAGLDLIDSARRMAATLGYESAVLRGNQGQVLVVAGRLDEGLPILDECWRSLLREPRGSAAWREGKFLLHHAAALRHLFGRIDESLAILSERPARGQDAADWSLDTVEAEARWLHGEVAAARSLVAKLELGVIERNVIPWAQVGRAGMLASAGELEPAAALARQAMPPHWQASSQLRTAELVRVLVAAGEPEPAEQFEARLRATAGFPATLELPLLDALAEAHLAAGRPDAVAAFAGRAAEAPSADPMRLRLEARIDLERDGADAARRLERAAGLFARMGWRQEEWRTRRFRAAALAGAGQQAAAEQELRAVAAQCEAGGEVLQARLAGAALAELGVRLAGARGEVEPPPAGATVVLTLRDGDAVSIRSFRDWAAREVVRRGGSTDGWLEGTLAATFEMPGAAAAAAAFRDKAAYHGLTVDATVSGPGVTAGREEGLLRLSDREREVALLVAQGLRNREIAGRLFLSERTVENHVHRALERTGLRSRAELAAWVARLSGELSVSPE